MKILHLYHDIMNLYGDYANISALKRILEYSGEDVTVDRISLGGSAVFSEYDFVYIGSGTERNQKTVLKDLEKYKDQLRDYISADKPVLMTGNSFEMLGHMITDGSGVNYKGLDLYDFTTVEEKGKRFTDDIICRADFLEQPLVGFINKSSKIFNIRQRLFTTEFGLGDNDEGGYEGIHDHNFFGTHLTGPILMKNPHFLIYLAAIILGREPDTTHLEYERKGYKVTLDKLSERAAK